MFTPLNTDRLPSRFVESNGKTYLWFSGTDYLGMAFHPRLVQLLSENLNSLGSHFGSSRNNSLRISVYEEAEKELAKFTGADDALLVSSGMLAGFIVRSTLPTILAELHPQHQIREYEAPMLHPALRRLGSKNPTWLIWAASLADQIRGESQGIYHVLYSDSIGTPLTSGYDFKLLSQLPDTLLVVDDAHGLGVLGENGEGSYPLIRSNTQQELLLIASLNKAMGVPGGVILGSRKILHKIRNSAFFGGSSPIPPIYAYALTQLIREGIYRQSHQQLKELNTYFLNQLTSPSAFHYVENYPVYVSSDAGLFHHLLSQNILVSCFPYPTQQDPVLTRIVITAAHQPNDLDWLAECCNSYFA